MTKFTVKQRKNLTKKKMAMPDGSYPIRNRSDLRNAISSYGRAKDKPKVKEWIVRRARELDSLDLIPDSWRNDIKEVAERLERTQNLKLSDNSEYLIHYGVLGMKWGVSKNIKAAKQYSKASRQADAYLNVAGATESLRSKKPKLVERSWKRTAKAAIKKDKAAKKFNSTGESVLKKINSEPNLKKQKKVKSFAQAKSQKVVSILKDSHNIERGLKEIERKEMNKIMLSGALGGPIAGIGYAFLSDSYHIVDTSRQLRNTKK